MKELKIEHSCNTQHIKPHPYETCLSNVVSNNIQDLPSSLWTTLRVDIKTINII